MVVVADDFLVEAHQDHTEEGLFQGLLQEVVREAPLKRDRDHLLQLGQEVQWKV